MANFPGIGALLQAGKQTVPEFGGTTKDLSLILPEKCDTGLAAKGRAILRAAQLQFQFIEAVIVLPGGQRNDLMFRQHGLDDGTALAFATAGTANHLRQHIKGRLRTPPAATIQVQIGIQHTNQGHIRQIQALGHHLCAEQYRDPVFLESVQDDFMGVDGVDGVRIHPLHGGIRQQGFQFQLGLLGADTKGLQGTAAGRTAVRYRLGEATVVAHQPLVGAVVGKPGAAAWAFRRFAAIHTEHRTAVAPTVQQQYGLLAGVLGIDDAIEEPVAEDGIVAVFQLLAHVHDLNCRQRLAVIAVIQGIEAVSTAFRPVHGFHRWGGRAQKDKAIFLDTPPEGNLTGIVTGIILGAVGMFLLLVDDNNTQLFTGCEHGAAGTHNDPGSIGTDPFPLVVPLAGRKTAVLDGNEVAEMSSQQTEKLGGQGDFRHKKQGAFAGVQTGLDQFQINSGFSRAGDAVQQRRAGFGKRHLGSQALKNGLLRFIQDQRAVQFGRPDLPAAKHFPFAQRQVSQFRQALDGGGTGTGIVA